MAKNGGVGNGKSFMKEKSNLSSVHLSSFIATTVSADTRSASGSSHKVKYFPFVHSLLFVGWAQWHQHQHHQHPLMLLNTVQLP
jgi:hypothetical protein